MKATIWHNPRCSKSRETLAILNETPGVEVEIVDYLKHPPTRARLADLESAKVLRLNDQHAFLALADDSDVLVGDVIEFGISHPCTCLDRHAILYGLDPDHSVTVAYLTSFG